MSLDAILKRTIARKAAGKNQTYPEHANKTAKSVNRGTAPSAPRPLPCAQIGPDSGPKGWHYCEHPDTPLGDIVCACKGCGPRCSGYSTAVAAPTAPAAIGLRHLAYHIFPVASASRAWRRGIDQLRARWPTFTGRKVVAVATGSGLAHPSEVADYLPPGCEILLFPNERKLREVASWVPIWERILDVAGSDDAVFYAHAKGVTRPDDPDNSCHWWASLLYSLLLDHPDLIDAQLARFPITGAFKKVGNGFAGSRSTFHYSGSFFWARAGDFQRRAWRGIPQEWWGNEAWPGTAYRAAEAGCVFHEGSVAKLDLYKPEYWRDVVRPEYAKWFKSHPPVAREVTA